LDKARKTRGVRSGWTSEGISRASDIALCRWHGTLPQVASSLKRILETVCGITVQNRCFLWKWVEKVEKILTAEDASAQRRKTRLWSTAVKSP
jgi:hypothetical protein